MIVKRALPAFIAINVIILVIYVYAFFFVLPNHSYLHPVAILLFVLSESSLYLTLSPIPLLQYQLALSSSSQLHQICKKCSQPRPPRAHHCSKCHRCIPRMSHHCSILSVCIGAHNFKPFLLLLFYGFLSALISFSFSLPDAIHVATRLYNRKQSITVFHIFHAQALYVQFAVAAASLALFLYHCYYISTGWTILEAHTISPKPRLFPPWCRSKTAFDRGLRNNFAQVFGTGYAVLLPVVDATRLVSIANEAFLDL